MLIKRIYEDELNGDIIEKYNGLTTTIQKHILVNILGARKVVASSRSISLDSDIRGDPRLRVNGLERNDLSI